MRELPSFAWGLLFPSPNKAVAWVPPASEKVLLSHIGGSGRLSWEPSAAALEAHWGEVELGHSLCCHTTGTPAPRTGGRGYVPAETSLVCDSEWHWHSILLHMKSTEALYSSFGLSDMEMRPWPWQLDRKILVWPWMRAQRHECGDASLPNEWGNSPLCRSAAFLPLGCLAFFPKSSISDNDVNCLLAIKYLLGPKTEFLESIWVFCFKIKDRNCIDLDNSVALITLKPK